MKMPFLFMFFYCLLIAGCVSTPNITRKPIYLYQTAQANECVLAETGPVTDRSPYNFIGKLREIDPQVYQCAVEIPIQEFEEKLGYCVLRGHNFSAEYDFYKGAASARSHSCDARPLVNGNFYFHTSGIDQDSCGWICFQSKK